jgi:predicted Fe-Mo cluster-binding NifX family protein
MSGVQHRPGLLGVVVAGLSVLSNSYLYSLSACAARKSSDPNLYNCTVQNKTNCFAAVLALAGVVLADLGLLRFDAICALMIGLLQFLGAFEIMRRAALDNAERAFTHKQRALVAVAAVACLIIGLELYHFGSHRDTVLIPSHGTFTSSSVDGLLGRADYFIIYDTRKRTVKPVVNAQRMSPNDVSDTIIKILEAKNVDIVLTRRIGEEMFSDLQRAGVRVYLIDKPGTVSQIFSDFQQGQLQLADGPNVARGFGRTKMHWLAPW